MSLRTSLLADDLDAEWGAGAASSLVPEGGPLSLGASDPPPPRLTSPSRPLLVSRPIARPSANAKDVSVAHSMPSRSGLATHAVPIRPALIAVRPVTGSPPAAAADVGPFASSYSSSYTSSSHHLRRVSDVDGSVSLAVGSVPVSSAVPRFVSSASPRAAPTSFAELRQAQRQSSPARIHQAQQRHAGAAAAALLLQEDGEDLEDGSVKFVPPVWSGSRPSTPSSAGSRPSPPMSVALSSISAVPVPSPRDELRLIWKLGYPVALAILFRVAMAVTDLGVLGHRSTDYLAAAASAQIWMTVTSAFLYRAFGSSLNTLCSQAFGAGNFQLVGVWLQQGLLFSTIASLFVGLSWWWTADVLRLLMIKDDVATLASTFARWSLLWLLPQVWMEMLQRYFQAQQIIFPALVLNAIFVLVNGATNLLMVFGIPAGWWPRAFSAHLHEVGWSGLGFIGSPIATAISRWLMFILYWLYTCVYRRYHAATFTGWSLTKTGALHPARIRQYLVKQCLPSAIGVCLEEWQLEIVAIFATQLGANQIATHNATLEIFFFLTSFMFGLVTAVQVRIGLYLGSGQPMAARQVAVIGLKASLVIGTVIGGCFVALRHYVGRVYSSDPAIWSLASEIAILVGAAYILLSFFYVAMGVLNGQGRPFLVAVAYLIGCWCTCLPLTYAFAFPLHRGLIGLWYGMCAGYLVVTLIVAWKAYTSDWTACAEQARARAELRLNALAEADADAADEAARKAKRAERRQRRRQEGRSRRRQASSRAGQSFGSSLDMSQDTDATSFATSTHDSIASMGALDADSSFLHRSTRGSTPTTTSLPDTLKHHQHHLHPRSHADDDYHELGGGSLDTDDSDLTTSEEEEEPWNIEEIRYREEQLTRMRREAAAIQAARASGTRQQPYTVASSVPAHSHMLAATGAPLDVTTFADSDLTSDELAPRSFA